MNSDDHWLDGAQDILRRFGMEELKGSREDHVRYGIYLRALQELPPNDDLEVLSIVALDPDRSMSGAVVVHRIDAVADVLQSLADFEEWVRSHEAWIDGNRFAERRVDEWQAVKKILESGTFDGFSTEEMTDWMQRKLAETTESSTVLDKLAEEGRTKRIRKIASIRNRN